MQLRPYQQSNLDEIRAHLRAGLRSVLWQLPTGGGKTLGAAFMLRTAAERGRRSWFVVHRRELVQQSRLAFQSADVPHGVIAQGFDMHLGQPVQIVSVQTALRRLDRLPAPDMLVLDEAHHCPAGSWRTLTERFAAAVRIGLSATPERLDGKGLAEYFQAMVRGPSVQELIAGGYLSRYRLYAPAQPDTSSLHTRAGDYAKDEVAELMDRPRIVGDAVDHYLKYARGRRALVFAVSIQASVRIVEAFNAAGVPAEHVDGDTPTETRDAAMQRLRDGATLVLSNVDLFGEGVDVPTVEAVVLLRPTQSLALYLQQVGRGLRAAEGKDRCVILDHAGNSRRHGLPDDDRDWTLEGRRGRAQAGDSDSVAPIRQCPSCFAINRATAKVCTECGEPFPVDARTVAEVDGELAEVDPEVVRKQARREQGRAGSLEALIQLGQQRGYKNPRAWALHVMRGRQMGQGKEYAKAREHA